MEAVFSTSRSIETFKLHTPIRFTRPARCNSSIAPQVSAYGTAMGFMAGFSAAGSKNHSGG